MVKATDCGIVVNEFVLQSHYYVHFWANTLGKGMNPLYPPSYGLNSTITVLLVLYIDLRPGQTCHSKVMHRKEVTHPDGSYEKKSRRQAWLIPWYTHKLMHRKRVTSELHDSYFRLMMIKHASPKTPEVAYSGLASHENRY